LFSSNDGLPQNTVYALAQDARGYVYAGTEGGLARYDADAWQALALPGDPVTRPIGALAVAADDTLWIGTSRGLWQRSGQHTVRLLQPSPDQTIYDLEVDGATIWVAAGDGLHRCTAANRCEPIEATRGRLVARLLAGRGPNGACLWFAVDGEGVYRLDLPAARDTVPAEFRLTRDDGLANNSVRALRQWGGADGADLWIGTGRGLARYDGRRVVRYHAPSGFPGGMVWAIEPAAEHDGVPVLLIGVRPGGLVAMRDDGHWTLETIANGLPENFVASLFHTRATDGTPTLWVGTVSSGIARSEPARWRRFDERDGLPDRVAIGIGRLRADGDVWLGTMRGAVRWRDAAWRPLLPAAFADRLVRDALVDDGGTLWAATERGLLRVDGEQAYEFTRDNSKLPAVGADLLALRRADDGVEELWVGTGHGLGRWRRDHGLSEIAMPGTDDTGVLALAVARAAGGAARVWVGCESGLYAYDDRGWLVPPQTCDSAALGPIIALLPQAAAQGEGLWVGGRFGVAYVGAEEGARCRVLPIALGRTAIAALALDARQRLYLFGTTGVLRLRVEHAGGAPRASAIERFTLADGLPALEFHGGRSAWLDAQGRLWAASSGGLAAYDPSGERQPAQPPPLELHAVLGGDGEAALVRGVTLPADTAELRFELRLLAYEREHLIRYRTELVGLDRTARPWTHANSVAYSRLPPGRYELRAWGRDAHGAIAGPATFPFTVAAPLWRRPWAIAGYALALVGLGLGVGRWRERALERRAQALEAEVSERTRELAEANQRLSEASLTDPLTGLRNRRYYAVEIEREVERTLRRVAAGEPHADLVLALIDVDHFKAINDRSGHDAGDAVLVEVGRRLLAFKRAGDFALRWGGEEFLLLLRDSDRGALEALAQRLLDLVANEPVATAVGPVAVTVSIGCAAFPLRRDAPRAQSFEQLLKLVDRALYQAKGAGRHCAFMVRWDAGARGDERGWRLVWQRVDASVKRA
jgi:diguanylate cyclase (GGDEF)-like protein